MSCVEYPPIPDSEFLELYDWQQHASHMRGHQVLEMIGEPVVANEITWQVYRVKYSHRKERPAEHTVAVQLAAGNVALPVFSKNFVNSVGEGDFDTGAIRIARQVMQMVKDDICLGYQTNQPPFVMHEEFRKATDAQA